MHVSRLDTCIRGGAVNNTSSRPWNSGFDARRQNLQIKITSKSWSPGPWLRVSLEHFMRCFELSPHRSVVITFSVLSSYPSGWPLKYGPRSSCTFAFGGVPRLLTTPGQVLTLSMPHKLRPQGFRMLMYSQSEDFISGDRTWNSTV